MSAALPLTVRVLAKTREAEGVASFELANLDGSPLPAFSAGAHIDVAIAPGLRAPTKRVGIVQNTDCALPSPKPPIISAAIASAP